MPRGDPVLQAEMAKFLPLMHAKMALAQLPPAAEMPPETDKDALIDLLVGALIKSISNCAQKERD